MDDELKIICNPWFYILIKTRSTIQLIVDIEPKMLVILLSMVGGIVYMFSNLNGNKSWLILEPCLSATVIVTIIGMVLGIIWLFLYSHIVKITGKILGGESSAENIRTAIAWSNIPIILVLLLWIFKIFYYGYEIFIIEDILLLEMKSQFNLLRWVNLVIDLLYLWSVLLFVICLSEVQNFSIIKSIANLILSMILTVSPILVTILGFIIYKLPQAIKILV